MNIKSEQAHELARQLAAVTGESLTTAVTVALQERLNRVRVSKEEKFKRMMEIASRCAPLFKEPYRSIDHGEMLYDDLGLPK